MEVDVLATVVVGSSRTCDGLRWRLWYMFSWMFGSGEELDVLVLGVHSALAVMKQNAMVVLLGESA